MMEHFDTWQQFSSWLDARGMFNMDFSLGRMYAVLQELRLEKPAFPIVQVLGTNGKGSTSAFLARLAETHGSRAGLYTSPHFVSPAERILVNGKSAPQELWLKAANALLATPTGPTLTYFEFLTVLTMLIFQQCGVDIAICEAGMGGAHDATTALPADLVCFTPIALDHADILGPGLEKIAADKAAAIRSSNPVFSAPQFEKAAKVLEERARSQHAPLRFVNALPGNAKIGMKGHTQRTNAALALEAWKHIAPMLRIKPDEKAMELALGSAFMPGRLQFAPATSGHPALLLDGAHNPHGMQALARELQAQKPAAIVFSALADKDWRDTLGLLSRVTRDIPMYIPEMNNSRAESAENLAAFRNRLAPGTARGFSGPSALEMALDKAFATTSAKAGFTLVTGSLYLLGEFFTLYPQLLERGE